MSSYLSLDKVMLRVWYCSYLNTCSGQRFVMRRYVPMLHTQLGWPTLCQMTSSKAAKAEFAKEYNQAFRLYIKAAESFLHLSRSGAQSDKSKQQWKANASKALERAERIKLFIEKSPASSLRLIPVAINHFSPRKSSNDSDSLSSLWCQRNNYTFWRREKMSTGSAFLCGMTLFNPPPSNPISALLGLFQSLVPSQRHSSDPDGQPKLSPDQQMNSCIWERPNQRPGQSVDILRRRILPEDILQHIVTDCSVCASISVCLEHSRRFGSTVSGSIFGSIIISWYFPQLAVSSLSTSQVDGRYDIRVLFNGAYRRVRSFFLYKKSR